MKGIRVRITKATLPAWYEKDIGKIFNVRKKPVKYCGGMGYKCIDMLGGILVKDCEVISEANR